MTTPERSVEEIVEEFNSTFPGCDQCQYGNGQGDWIEHWLTQTLQTERQRCEEMVEAERERIKNWAEDYGVYTDGNLREMGRSDACRQLIKNLTQPNNPK